MKTQLAQLIIQALEALTARGDLSLEKVPTSASIHIERTKDEKHGDYASNVALTLARQARCSPRDIAQLIVSALPSAKDSVIERTEIAGPGFINFFIDSATALNVIKDVLAQAEGFGKAAVKPENPKVLIEFVSANPTGPLHVGHGRGAAYGSCIANLLDNAGYDVTKEYYVNDAGRQMDILAVSVWLRYLQALNVSQKAMFDFPANIYQGGYVQDIAQTLLAQRGDALQHGAAMDDFFVLYAGEDSDAALDDLIAKTKDFLGDDNYRTILQLALQTIQGSIKDDLAGFKVNYDHWYSERSLHDSSKIEQSIDAFKKAGHLYQKDGAWWFRSHQFGDEKDRVVVRGNGSMTYFAADIAYHQEKFERGFDKVIDIFGADHHGYVPRLRAILSALGIEQTRLDVLLIQFANLWRNGEKVQMSTRSGQFVTLQALIDEVGVDATRFFYVMRKSDQHLDFDLTLAKSTTSENPVYYVQYAHARICSVMRQLDEKGLSWDKTEGLANLSCLKAKHETALMESLSRYPEVTARAASQLAPHSVVTYLRECATEFHAYYNSSQFIVDDATVRNARLALIQATRQVINNGLCLLGIVAPEKM